MATAATTTGTELRSFLDRLISHLEEVNGSDSIELSEDYFWSIPLPEIYDVTEKPQELTLGSLADCLEFLGRDGDDISWMAVWLGQLLVGVGHAAHN